MNFKDAAKSIIKPHEEDHLTPLTTVWGENIDLSARCRNTQGPRCSGNLLYL